MMMMMMIIILLPLLEWAAADEKTFCFFEGRLSSLLRLPLAARLAEIWMLMEVLLKLTVSSFMILAQGRAGYGGL